MEVEIPITMKKPVFIYYKLDNYYQSHRRYIKSKDVSQLAGQKRTNKELESNCGT